MRPAQTYVEAALREQGEHVTRFRDGERDYHEHGTAFPQDGEHSVRVAERPALAPLPHGRHDHAARRRAKRSGREGGCWTYISAELLREAGYAPGDPLPWYRVWAGRRGRFVVTLYREP